MSHRQQIDDLWDCVTHDVGLSIRRVRARLLTQRSAVLVGEFADEGDAKLAVQAPAMARLLLKLRERDGVDSNDMAEIDEVLRAAGVAP